MKSKIKYQNLIIPPIVAGIIDGRCLFPAPLLSTIRFQINIVNQADKNFSITIDVGYKVPQGELWNEAG